jgi:hypothetical protein
MPLLKNMEKNKLYVLVNKELNPIYGCVQGGHAVAQWLIDNKEQTWNNQYLIYLSANIEKWMTRLEIMGYNYTVFREPDLDDAPTAIAIEHNGSIFKNLRPVGHGTNP